METNDLKIFYEVAQLRSTIKAAEKLNYVQSTVSKKIARLENQLGKKLFHRTNRGMTLTKEGEQFLTYAAQILATVSELEEAFQIEETQIRIGSTQSITKNHLQRYIFDETVEICIKSITELIQGIKAGTIDFMIVNKKIKDQQLKETQRIEEKIVWTQAKGNNTELFKNKILISRDKDCPYRKATLDILNEEKQLEISIIELDTLDIMLTMLETNKAAAILPKQLVTANEKLQELPNQVPNQGTIYVYAGKKNPINKKFKLL
ncbi:LysR family transcriptional regulator [Enterococcus wangshanyuanii]|uniref:HTH-type transcriptional regulator YofA n=1 Tax=Enterococcus wangshanyuanii TaxID=2005703 RepID=A0ABQ1P7W8_9ENTE|nr:LysR family transcriptional regulator [Enterococcus wangshanyuanii]GGC92378.1 HTH-type transcriptional regulator YofA [Enterococcus wangshanyuanii]